MPAHSCWPPTNVAATFELLGVLEYDASTDELLPVELDPSATTAYADRPRAAERRSPESRCDGCGDIVRYCGCDPTC